jgi:hypothetical protein
MANLNMLRALTKGVRIVPAIKDKDHDAATATNGVSPHCIEGVSPMTPSMVFPLHSAPTHLVVVISVVAIATLSSRNWMVLEQYHF